MGEAVGKKALSSASLCTGAPGAGGSSAASWPDGGFPRPMAKPIVPSGPFA
jgi:hypothetical protein